jgi:hypothetical protein
MVTMTTHNVHDANYVTALLCANVDDLDSAQWSFFTQFALTWLASQSVLQHDYLAHSQMSLNNGPWMDGLHRTCFGTTNVDVIRWMIPYHSLDDPVGAMSKDVRSSLHHHPLHILQADANDLESLSTHPDMQQTARMVHYRLTKMLIRLALMVRNLGQPRLDSPDYILFLRI